MNTNELLDALQTEIDRVQGKRLCDAINVNVTESGESILVGDDRVTALLSMEHACEFLSALQALPDNAGWDAAWDACPHAEPLERVTES